MEAYYDHAGITIYHGDCREVLPGLGRDVTCFVMSPPYNQRIETFKPSGMQKNWNWTNKISAGYSDSMDELAYQAVQVEVLQACASRITEDGSLFYNHKWRWRDGLAIYPLAWIDNATISLRLRQELVWSRDGSPTLNARMFAPSDERIYWLVAGRHKWNQSQVGKMTVWSIPSHKRDKHPCSFPVEIPRRCILATTDEGDVVCDPFMGSGTTLRAAKDLGRKAIGIEIEEKYCEIAAKRLQQEVFDFGKVS